MLTLFQTFEYATYDMLHIEQWTAKRIKKISGLGRVFRPGPEIRVPGREIFPGRVSGLDFSNAGFGPGSGFHFEIFRVSSPGTRPVPIPGLKRCSLAVTYY